MNRTIKKIADTIDEAICNPKDNDSVYCANIIYYSVLASLDTPELRGDIEELLSQYSSSLLAWKSWGMNAVEKTHNLKLEIAAQILALITKPEEHSPEPSWHHRHTVLDPNYIKYGYVLSAGNI